MVLRKVWRDVYFIASRTAWRLGRPLVRAGFRRRYGAFKLHLDPADHEISRTLWFEGAWANGEVALMAKYVRPGSVAIDLGANIGCHTLPLSTFVGPTGQVLAFEPTPQTYRILSRNLESNGITNVLAVPIAASDSWGQVTMHISARNKGANSMAFQNLADGTAQISVPAACVDDLIDQWMPNKVVSFIKADIQGAEGLAFAGMRRLVERSRPAILTEFSAGAIRHVGGNPEALLQWFEQLDYQFYVMASDGACTPTNPALVKQRFGDTECYLLLLPKG